MSYETQSKILTLIQVALIGCLLLQAFVHVMEPNIAAEHCRASGMVPVQYNGSVYCASIESLKVPK